PGLYLIHLDGAERSFSYWRETSAARHLADDRLHLANALEGASVVYLSGITLAILPQDDAMFLLERLKAETAAGKIVVFDPNIRPSLWSSAERMRDLIELTAENSTIVMPSFDDEQSAFGDETPRATLDRYSDVGAAIVVLKNGTGDVMVRTSGQIQSFPTRIVDEPIDTTGAGDAFNGAFIAEYVSSRDIGRAVSSGQDCSAKVVCHRGALMPPGG
ncbi:MAG: sugar kinase, partial [Aestuariivirgaceae bacterium]